MVISAGFAEVGGEGPERQRELVEICRRWGMRLVGPNCMGVVNTDPEVDLNGTFATVAPDPGTVGFLSQSGAVGLAVMSETGRRGIGLSSFVSVGNKTDVSGNDLIQYWAEDEDTALILLYLESFGNPRTFARLARRIGRAKPIIAVKSGRSQAGARATSSHTGALLAADTASPYGVSWSTTGYSNGTHTLLAKAFDAAGNATSASVSVTVQNSGSDSIPPTAVITSPATGSSVTGSVNVSVKATDNVRVARVELYVDGSLYASSTSATP